MDHPLLRRQAIEERAYQVNIAARCLERSTLVVLPTGMGKTVIAALVVAETLRRKGGRVLFLAPTKPLVEQHAAYLKDVLLAGDVAVFTGEKPPEDRELEWRTCKVVCSTPQVIENDLRQERISLEEVSLVVFDEAHRAVGDYAYVDVAAKYRERGGLVLGMTASPGSQIGRILEVCQNLGVTPDHVEIRLETDSDVSPYFPGIEVERVFVDVPEQAGRARDLLRSVLDEQVAGLRALGYLRDRPRPTTRDFLAVGRQVREALDSGRKSGPTFRAATVQALAMKVNHAIELVETQGTEALRNYVGRMGEGDSRANRAFLRHPKVAEALALSAAEAPEHPKVRKAVWKVREQFRQKPDSRVIVFTHYRDMATVMERELARVPGIKPVRFVGQASRGGDEGLSQKEQVGILEKFRAGAHNVLVATSVAEEGLDIPQVDLVIFYEPVPSEIRTIQRRGRTGRRYAGHVAVLVTKDTRDMAYLYSARRKETKMHAELDRLRRELRQKIFVGTPGGETSVAASPKGRIEGLRAVEAKPEDPPPRPKKPGQADLTDFART